MTENFYKNCTLCPRNCKVDRTKCTGMCREGSTVRAARAGLHFYEEPFISGTEGSGTVFFSGCSLGCVYCQNAQISREGAGFEISIGRLADIFLELQDKCANNINLVTGTHFTPSIVDALRIAKDNGLHIPVLWNSSGYEKPDTLKLMDGLVDIFMPDFKTMSSELGMRYMKAPDYPEIAMAALECMVKMAGRVQFDSHQRTEAGKNEQGILMKRGVLARHLVIPGHTKDSRDVIKYLYETYGDDIWISIMSQYTPLGPFAITGQAYAGNDSNRRAASVNRPENKVDHLDLPEKYPELTRSVTKREYEKVVDFALSLGITNCMIQEGGAVSESFIPRFDGEGL